MIQSKEKLSLKAVLIMLISLSTFLGCVENGTNPYTTVELKEGLPVALKSVEEDLPFKNFSYANLNTGTDTLQIYLGTFMQGSNKGYWSGIESNGIPAHFSTVSLEEVDTLDYRSKDIEIEFNEDKNRVALRIIEIDSLTFKYAWLDNSELSKTLALKSIEKPLRINSQFPEMNLESLSGEDFSTSGFKNQFVVINWWSTWCAPCIKEIPDLNKISDKFFNKENVRFIAITNDPRSRITSFLKKKDFNYEMTFANSEVQNLFGNSYPVNIIIDPKGNITYLSKGAGLHTHQEIETSLRQQLKRYNSKEIVNMK